LLPAHEGHAECVHEQRPRARAIEEQISRHRFAARDTDRGDEAILVTLDCADAARDELHADALRERAQLARVGRDVEVVAVFESREHRAQVVCRMRKLAGASGDRGNRIFVEIELPTGRFEPVHVVVKGHRLEACADLAEGQ
jgi:hypothetical protein